MPCSSEKAQRFGETTHLHFQGKRESKVWNYQKQMANSLFNLVELICSSRTFGFPQTTWPYNQEEPNDHSHYDENLKSSNCR
jgi:hypothetical protein